MVEPVTILTGIALVKKSVDFIKTNIGTVQDIGDIIGHVDKALTGQQQVIKDRDSKNVDHFAVENVAKEVIDAKLAQEQLYEMKQLVNHRFGHGTWEYILEERKKRIDKRESGNTEYFTILNTNTMSWNLAKYKGKAPLCRYGHTVTSIGPHLLIFGKPSFP